MVGLKRASPAKARLPRVALIARYISPPHLIYRTPVGGSGRVDILTRPRPLQLEVPLPNVSRTPGQRAGPLPAATLSFVSNRDGVKHTDDIL